MSDGNETGAAIAPPITYETAHEGIRETEKYAMSLVAHHAEIEDRYQRGALAERARDAARALSYLADTFELLGQPWSP